MTERLPPIPAEKLTPEQSQVLAAIESGPRGPGAQGPFHALLRCPELCDLVQRFGAHVRFKNSLPRRLNELAICLTARHWTAQYEFYAHSKLAIAAGAKSATLAAVAKGERPADIDDAERTVYDFVTELLATGAVSEPRYEALRSRFGERGVIDLVGTLGYYSLVSLVLNVALVPLPAGATPLAPHAK